jgi:GGDEF domain-containing protein
MYAQVSQIVLSIKALIDHPERTVTAALHRAISILLGGISVYAFPYSASKLTAFQSAIDGIRARFDQAHNEDSVLELAGSALRSIEQYSADAERFESSQVKEMKRTVGMLTDSLLQASEGTTESVQSLTRIRTDLETITRLETLAAINDKLRVCLAALGEEVNRQNRRREQIRAELERAVSIEAAAPEVDPSTGLAGAKAGMRTIREMIRSRKPGRVLVFALDRMEAINLRFGVAVSDQILMLFAQHARHRLQLGETLYRWRGSCFIATSQRAIPEPVAATEAARIAGARIEHTMEAGEREISIAVTASWTVLPISDKSCAEDVLRKVDDFASHRSHVMLD